MWKNQRQSLCIGETTKGNHHIARWKKFPNNSAWIFDHILDHRWSCWGQNYPDPYLPLSLPDDKVVNMLLEGEFVDTMCEVNLEYKEFITEEWEKKILYVRLLQAIYRMIESALLWYELFTTTLPWLGFKLDIYDRCLASLSMGNNAPFHGMSRITRFHIWIMRSIQWSQRRSGIWKIGKNNWQERHILRNWYGVHWRQKSGHHNTTTS